MLTIADLKEIIRLNEEPAEMGCPVAQGQVIEAQAEIERLEKEELTEWTMYDADGTTLLW